MKLLRPLLTAGLVLALAGPALAVPPAQPNGTVPSVGNKHSMPKGTAKDAKGKKHAKHTSTSKHHQAHGSSTKTNHS